MKAHDSITILAAEDDEQDRFLLQRAWKKAKLINPLVFVEDGVELLEYLRHEGQWAGPKDAPRPGLILLDLNMPRMDGVEVLATLKEDKDLRSIPVIAFTTSKQDQDILKTYDLGISSFITKPINFLDLVDIVERLKSFWLEIVEYPRPS